MSEFVEGVVSLGDKRIEKPQRNFSDEPVRRIKMTSGEVIRVSFISDEVVARARHYLRNKGYRRCLSYSGFCPACIAAERDSEFHKKDLNRASSSFGANIFVYETDDEGNLTEGTPKGDNYLFIFGEEKFASLRSIKNMYGSLVGLDLLITCTDSNFQKMTIQAFPPQMSAASNPQVMKAITAKIKKDGYPLDKFIAKEVSPAQLVKEYELDRRILELPEAGMQESPRMVEMAVEDSTDIGNTAPPVAPKKSSTSFKQTQKAPKAEERTVNVDTGSLLDEL